MLCKLAIRYLTERAVSTRFNRKMSDPTKKDLRLTQKDPSSKKAPQPGTQAFTKKGCTLFINESIPKVAQDVVK